MGRGLVIAGMALSSSMAFSSVTLSWDLPTTRVDGSPLDEVKHTVINYDCGRQVGEIIVKGVSVELDVYGNCTFNVWVVDNNGVPSSAVKLTEAIAPPAPKWIK
jgi:hypothetical protein